MLETPDTPLFAAPHDVVLRDGSTVRVRDTPRSIALVGASGAPGSVGAAVLANLQRSFAGTLQLVTRRHKTVGASPRTRPCSACPARSTLRSSPSARRRSPPRSTSALRDSRSRQRVSPGAVEQRLPMAARPCTSKVVS